MGKHKSVCDVGDKTMEKVAEFCKAHPLKRTHYYDPMQGCCPHVSYTDREPCCGLGGICWDNQSTCQARRRTTCEYSDGQHCEDYDNCPCRDCGTKTDCVSLNCGELCACRTGEERNFGETK